MSEKKQAEASAILAILIGINKHAFNNIGFSARYNA